MYTESLQSSDISFPDTGSHLLSESVSLPSSSYTGHGGDDLSISELSISNRIAPIPFSLLAPPVPAPLIEPEAPDNMPLGENNEIQSETEEAEKHLRAAAKQREERLQNDIFILRKLNASLSTFNEALEETESANDRLAAQIEQTDALLSKYVNILSKSEHYARLVFDERWHGADSDEQVLEQERKEREEIARKEAEERDLAKRRERERLEKEEAENLKREESERLGKEREERLAAKGVRGVRGTRASMRGTRGATRGSSSSARGGAVGTSAVQSNSGGIPIKRPASVNARGASSRGGNTTRRS